MRTLYLEQAAEAAKKLAVRTPATEAERARFRELLAAALDKRFGSGARRFLESEEAAYY